MGTVVTAQYGVNFTFTPQVRISYGSGFIGLRRLTSNWQSTFGTCGYYFKRYPGSFLDYSWSFKSNFDAAVNSKATLLKKDKHRHI